MTTTPTPCISAAPFTTAPHQLLPAIPYLVGYRPSDSLVAVFLHDDAAVAMTARLDWDVCRADPHGVAVAIADQSAMSEPTAVLLAAVDAVPGDGDALATVASVLSERGLVVIWAGHHDGDTWRGLACDAMGCDVHRLDPAAPPSIVPELVAAGRAPLPDRAAIGSEVARPHDAEPIGALRRPKGVDIEAWRDEVLRSCSDILAGAGDLMPSDVAVFAAGCRDIRVRDVLLWRLTVGPEHVLVGWRHAWGIVADVLRRCSNADVAAVGAVGSVVAWQLGDGIRAHACLDRAEVADPEHSLAGLVRRSLVAGCPPSVWREVMASLTESDCRHGTS